jgi:DtxR family Mn-dependent transcriptional regulator
VSLLVWTLIGLSVLVALLAPTHGVMARVRRYRRALARERAENALKHLLGQASAGRGATLPSLQSALRLSDRAILALTERLEREGLIRADGSEFRLTPEGERVALHVLRAHRLWELYLADEVGVPLDRVHTEAERAEHNLTAADLDRLSAAMGHPDLDPHGDPIPGGDGVLSAQGGTPLSSWPPGVPARIVHLEDEPPLAYAQLTAEGLHLGQVLRIIDRSPTRLVLSDGESEHVLAPMLAGNVHVAAVDGHRARPAGIMRLSDLPPRTAAEIVGLDASCRGFMRRRLLDLGFTPGARIRRDLTTFAGDPSGYRLRGTTIALRREQAQSVLVRALRTAEADDETEAGDSNAAPLESPRAGVR